MNTSDTLMDQQVGRMPAVVWVSGILLPIVILGIFLLAPVRTRHPNFPAQQTVDHNMPGMHHGAAAEEETPGQKAKRLVDERESEFNHHLAGALVIVAALFFLAQGSFEKRWPAVIFAWPMCFLATGLFVLLFSDTEIWPFGYQSFCYAVMHDLEVAQHKAFALILLALGMVEAFRVSGRWRASWSAWVFPVIGLGGAVLLLFHHHGGMHGPDAMQVMEQVQYQHFLFAGVGASIALTKGLADSSTRRRALMNEVWPILMIFLGILLLLYRE